MGVRDVIVLPAIRFHNHSSLGASKVGDEWPDRDLPAELEPL